MKYAKPSGRLLADVGEERKRKLYKRLFDLRLSFKEWLKNQIDKFLQESEEKE